MTRKMARVAGLAVVMVVMAIPASAQIVSSLQLGVGGFFPRGAGNRASGDVLVRDMQGLPFAGTNVTDALVFEIGDFRGGHVFGEYNIGFGPHLEVGVGVGGYGRHVPSVYRDITELGTNREIQQELGLKIVPVTFLARFLPFGDSSTVQPYVGVGVAALNYRYTEIGDFVDSDSLAIFTDNLRAKGTAVGGVLAGGLRIPIRGDIYAISMEGRYIYGVGETGGSAAGFLADKIDLSGGLLNFGFTVRF